MAPARGRTTTARTLERLRQAGAIAAVVERLIRIPCHPPFSRDLFGFGDIIAVVPDSPGCLMVQACITAHQANRLAKILSPRVASNALRWLEAGNRIEVWAWSKRGRGEHSHGRDGRFLADGSRRLYVVSITVVSIDMIHQRALDVAEAHS